MCVSQVGRVWTVDAATGAAAVDVDGVTRRISVAPLVLDGRTVRPGDWLLVHAGLAVDILDEGVAADLSDFVRSRLEVPS